MEYFIELSFKNVKFKREKYYIKKKKNVRTINKFKM